MDNFKSILGDAAGGALCNLLTTYGNASGALFALSLIEPTPFGEVVATTAGLAGLAALYGCTWDPNAPGPTDDTGLPTGCKKTDGEIQIRRYQGSTFIGTIVFNIREILNLTSTYLREGPAGSVYQTDMDYIDTDGSTQKTTWEISPAVETDLSEVVSGTCLDNLPTPPPPDPPVYPYTDPASGCQLNVEFKGWAVGTADTVNGVWRISPEPSVARASGGVIGGCNFEPVFYIDGGDDGNGGDRYFTEPTPTPPDGDEPWWVPRIRDKTEDPGVKRNRDLIKKLLEEPIAGGEYVLNGVCEIDDEGNPIQVTEKVPYPAAIPLESIVARIDALTALIQFHKNLRQPACEEKPPEQPGEPVTVTFISKEKSPVSDDPVRKIMTYFDQSGQSQLTHMLHWKNFTWRSGPVIVSTNKTLLGKTQVWAASIEEGKRVILHAAAVAGVDMTKAEWVVTSPRSNRYGLVATMGLYIDKYQRHWVTKRNGPDGQPYVYMPET